MRKKKFNQNELRTLLKQLEKFRRKCKHLGERNRLKWIHMISFVEGTPTNFSEAIKLNDLYYADFTEEDFEKYRKKFEEKLAKILEPLNESERKVFILRGGCDDLSDARTPDEVAGFLKISTEEIRKIEETAMDKIQKCLKRK